MNEPTTSSPTRVSDTPALASPEELLARLRSMGVQLTLEGDTLRLNAPKGLLTPALQSELKASKAALLDLLRAAQLRAAQQQVSATSSRTLERVPRQTFMPLSFAQQRLWFLQQMDPESTAYNLLVVMRLQGDLRVGILERALHQIILRHEGLRTCFVQRDGSPYTTIVDGLDWKLTTLPLHRLPDESSEQAVTRFARETTQQPFSLESGPLLRAYLLRDSEQESLLVLSIHHIVSDGWSLGVLCQELAENYRAFLLEESPRIADLAIQYVDFAEWQREWLGGGVLERQMRYWRKQLEGSPSVVLFPPDHPRSPLAAGQGKRLKLVLPIALVDQLQAFSRAHDATLFMTMLSAFLLLLSRYSGNKDVVVGSPSANRPRAELSELIGFFVNNLVLRAQVDDGISFLELLARVRESTLGAFENQDVPFDQLVRELQTDRNPDYAPLFQTMFILQNFPLEEMKLPGLTVAPMEIDASTARFDFTAEVYPYRGELFVYFDYRVDLYEEETISQLQQSFRHVLEFVTTHPEVAVDRVPLFAPAVRAELLAFGNPELVELPPGSSLLQTFARSVQDSPEKIAVRDRAQAFTYRQLNDAADTLARHLRHAGASPGSLIPVCLHRSTQLLISLLAVLKTGAAYVPLDPIYPRHRIAGILDDLKPTVLLTEAPLLPLLSGYEAQSLLLDSVLAAPFPSGGAESIPFPAAESLAYVIFTSGSTGKPKGVEISHAALANFLDSMRRQPGFTREDRLLAVTTISFDIAGLELYLPLYVGGEVIVAEAPADLPALLEDLAREAPTMMQATPALWQMLLSAGWPGDSNLTALCGGEALSPTLANTLAPRVKALWNMYGPTETTIWSSALQIHSESGSSVPIGGPIQNTTFYVLDPHQEPAPLGVAGELYIGGQGLARGYFHRDDLTAERFVHSTFGERLYRTGDLVRRRRDGLLEFLGRADFQVKLRGFRIELGEIEHALRQQPEIAESVVLLRQGSDKHDSAEKELVAYVVLRPGQSLPAPRLRQRLRERLPEYMVPSSTVVLPQFPRLPNGKLDRSRLPAPVSEKEQTSAPILPGNATQAAILRVFRELLHSENIGIEDRFFDIGAHSLLLVKAHDRLRKEIDPELRLVSFFQFPTIAALAAHIENSRTPNHVQPPAAEEMTTHVGPS